MVVPTLGLKINASNVAHNAIDGAPLCIAPDVAKRKFANHRPTGPGFANRFAN